MIPGMSNWISVPLMIIAWFIGLGVLAAARWGFSGKSATAPPRLLTFAVGLCVAAVIIGNLIAFLLKR